MPIISIQKVNDHCIWGIWEIQETEDQLFSMLNMKLEDETELSQIHNLSKRLEWLTGKLIIKQLVEHAGGLYRGLFKDEHGKPFLRELPFQISISHSQKYVVCILSVKESVGIDLEKIRPKVLNVQAKFLSEKELETTREDLEILTKFWCSKEALYKLNGKKGVIFTRDIYVELYHGSPDCIGFINYNGTVYKKDIFINRLDDYIIALAL